MWITDSVADGCVGMPARFRSANSCGWKFRCRFEMKLVSVEIRPADGTSCTFRATDCMPSFIRSFKERLHVRATETCCPVSELFSRNFSSEDKFW
jgi:hypothetical protein